MTRYLVIGASGQLGTHLLRLLGEDAIGVGRADLDLTSAAAVSARIGDVRPNVVVNAAAWTAVDDAETSEDAAYAVNATAPLHLARAVAERGGRLVHVSTDYVFDGAGTRPYEPDDPTKPRTAYGRTKLAGEQAVLSALPSAWVVRTAWIYGGPSANFVDTMLRLAQSRPTVDVVADQTGSPTWVRDLAEALVTLAESAARPGVLHYVNTGTATWFELAQEVFRAAGHDPDRVRPTTSAAFVRPAPRPAWSVLSTASWTARGLPAPRDWRSAVQEYVATRRDGPTVRKSPSRAD
jgi:dTDP-4-dehydrorhamnose reductase